MYCPLVPVSIAPIHLFEFISTPVVLVYLGLCTVLLCLSLLLLDDSSLPQMLHLNLFSLIILFAQSTVLVCLFLFVLVLKLLPHIEQQYCLCTSFTLSLSKYKVPECPLPSFGP